MGAKIKSPKNPWTKNYPPPHPPPKKNPIHNYAAGISRQTTNNNFQLNQAIRQNFCQIFLSYPKKIPKSKISNPKTPSIKPVTWNPEYHWGFVPPQFLNRKFCLWRTSLHQNRLSNTKLTRRDLRVNRKQPRMGKEPSIFYFLETEIHSTGKRRTLNSGERACNHLKWVS